MLDIEAEVWWEGWEVGWCWEARTEDLMELVRKESVKDLECECWGRKELPPVKRLRDGWAGEGEVAR